MSLLNTMTDLIEGLDRFDDDGNLIEEDYYDENEKYVDPEQIREEFEDFVYDIQQDLMDYAKTNGLPILQKPNYHELLNLFETELEIDPVKDHSERINSTQTQHPSTSKSDSEPR